eukprot:TRINITY_DN681_c1_g1_i2.p1 TRINITY_DN681_c1_g1~~TRINITY_DN681_c1_g1_i2.p1  ORF type:complete len:381 (+),score=69.02 TRINITY_DN681_c1_g1_i2:142-1143(+)
MKSILVRQFGGPEVLVVEEVPIPQPGSKQVLVKVYSAGVNPVETYQRSGQYAALPPLPWVPGKDAAGVVESVGSDVTTVKPHQRVWLSASDTGTYAQYCLAPAASVHPLPDKYTFAQGAALWTPYATAYHGLFHIGQPPDQGKYTLLVHGASGGVGIATLQLAKIKPDVTVIGTAGTEEGVKLVLSNGADFAFNHREPNYTNKIMEATGGKGVDIILEMLANVNLNNDLTLLAKGGCVCVVGNRGAIDGFNPRLLMQKRSSVRGVMLSQITDQEKKEIIEGLNSALVNEKINPHEGLHYTLTDAPVCHNHIINPPSGGQGGKLTIHPWKEAQL